ncbi:MAG: LysM peptidoglycan-binding domain-containing protein [Roseburia sp.]|nr:LysM peptidoglycan-binding domain-containing protein [Roseburia sp.]MCM1243331.1 LysM peptidoglycan-binding domain-containing protein [Roseburia sp.]
MRNRRSENRIRRNRIRRQREIRRHMMMGIMTLCLVITFSFSVNGFLSKAKDDSEPASFKYYKSITIANDDTLWSIAQEYMDEEHYDSTEDYIKEVKKLNKLNNDTITYGEHLIVPYYSNEYVG